MLEDSHLARLLANGIKIVEPRSTRIDLSAVIEPGVLIHQNVAILGNSLIASNCTIHQGSELVDVSLGSESTVRMCSDIRDSTFGSSARLGPFVEVNKVQAGDSLTVHAHSQLTRCALGSGVKVSSGCHLTDIRAGSRLNFSSGARTANYDGAMKHITFIGDDVFIGANALLIAPVAIGDGATVGGGSVISRDVSPGLLAVARAEQVEIRGWQRPKEKGESHEPSAGGLQVNAALPRDRQLEARIFAFRQLVDRNDSEQSYHTFLADNYWLCGAGYVDCTSKGRAGATHVPDLLLERHDGLYEVVEIKRPSVRLFVYAGNRCLESKELKAAVTQAHDYLEYYDTHRLSESHIREEDFRVLKAKVIIGRTVSADDQKALARVNTRYSRIEVLSYDDLLALGESMRAHVARVQSTLADPQGAA